MKNSSKTKHKQIKVALQESEQNYHLLATYYKRLNDISITFTEASSTEELFTRISDSFRFLTDAIAATFSVYDQETRTLKVVSLSTDPISSAKISSIFGPHLFEMRMPVSATDREQMLRQGIKRPKDLCELSFDAIPQEISDAVMDAIGCRQIIALAISYTEQLVGACVAYLPGNQPLVPDDALKTYKYLAGLSINRRWAEAALQDSEKRYRRLFESAKDGILILDAFTGKVVDVNPFLLHLLGYSFDELYGQHIWDLGIFKDIAASKDAFQALQDNEYIRYDDLPLETRDGHPIAVEFVSNVYIVDHSKVIQCNIRDISERKQANKDKSKLQDQLFQAQKMESIARLAGGVAHDFNNMLGVILGHTEMAMEQVDPSLALYANIKEIHNAASRSADLTRQLLAFARRQTVSPKVLDINETVQGMLKMLQRLIGENIQLVWLPGINLWQVKIDPSQLDQILANLCVNARDAIADVGKVTIETGNITFDEAYCIHNMGSVPGEYALLSVSDNGTGMSREILGKLFEPFFTTKEVGKGTGLGLATVYGIVKQNNGFINVYSEPDQGTTFRIYLPRYIGKGEQATAKKQEQVIGGYETVLLVEDEAALLALCKRMLEQLGYQVLCAGTPGEAIRVAEEHRGKIHLLMTDVVMPEMNGRDLANKLLSLYPDLKCLFMSGYTADVIVHQGVLDEGVHFIQKPFSVKNLADKVRAALDQK